MNKEDGLRHHDHRLLRKFRRNQTVHFVVESAEILRRVTALEENQVVRFQRFAEKIHEAEASGNDGFRFQFHDFVFRIICSQPFADAVVLRQIAEVRMHGNAEIENPLFAGLKLRQSLCLPADMAVVKEIDNHPVWRTENFFYQRVHVDPLLLSAEQPADEFDGKEKTVFRF